MQPWTTDIPEGTEERCPSCDRKSVLCGCRPRCAPKCENPRRWLSRTSITVTPETPSITLDPNDCGVTSIGDLDDLWIWIRRRGKTDWNVKYPAFDILYDGTIQFVLDHRLFDMKPGRYEAEIRLGCDKCGLFEIILPKDCSGLARKAKAVPGHKTVIHQGELSAVTDIYNEIYNFSAELCSILEPDAVELPVESCVAEDLCAMTLCRPAQLIVYDGTKEEIVNFTGCIDGVPTIERGKAGTAVGRFPKGSTISFSWTPDNVVAACEGCP